MKYLAWVAALLVATPALASSLDAYKAQVAQHIHKTSRSETFDGAAPPLLKSIVVLEITIDAKGTAHARIVRSNGFKELEARALQSVKRATPLPRFSGAGSKPVTYYETWLFRNDGRFQIRSIAPAQSRA